MQFLLDDQGFAGPERPHARIPGITHIRYRRSDLIIEVSHVVGYMGENHVETRCLRTDDDGHGDWIALGDTTTRTGYQLRRALDLQARAICAHLGLA
jgi:hypothetical protein